ncbi:thiol-disulfide oxidoreductase ResA [Geobacter sp. OR-1]|uniref:redoxin domain-containing protein n=1 Tax=Geobacter sp. OR-1 TaxID=1266765 RepID=UPI000543F83C|nr:redoxin domain-containing protein [Geobacter sp. OR-1]GAM09725.1 thiol-disulfide oxidoreductase ResA [Geobacter sp. OR-1]
MSFSRLFGLLLLCCLLSACGDNLIPSGEDKRPTAQPGTTGPAVGQLAPEFSVPDINGRTVTLANALADKKGIVLYFTMWCPICDSHMSHLRAAIAPNFPNVGFYAVDYVSGSVGDAAAAASANGYAGGTLTILADVAHQLTNSYQGTMGTTIIIDSSGVVRMNEDYRDGSRLQAGLAGLP